MSATSISTQNKRLGISKIEIWGGGASGFQLIAFRANFNFSKLKIVL
jgi:hypothetical protein